MALSAVFFLHVALCVAMPEPDEYILSFPLMDNPLNISVVSPFSKNYMLLIGDWGAEGLEDQKVQQAVADKMNEFYEKQSAEGFNLLSILSLGDNFYYTGQSCREYGDHWRKVYGQNLTSSIPWIATMGNHDWGDSDEWALCAYNAPINRQYIQPDTQIPYASNQLNEDKGGCNPHNYYLPDFGYYYSLRKLSLEIIVVEESSHDCDDLGGGYGSTITYSNCNGYEKGCSYLRKIDNATELLLIKRAKVSNATNIIIQQHYPEQAERLLKLWKDHRKNGHENDTVWTVFGHAHTQQCNGYDVGSGECNQILSGGGGGCCLEHSLRGFYVIGFDEKGKMIQPYMFNDSALSCPYPCDETVELTAEYMMGAGFETCCNTKDASIDCKLYDLKQCNK